MTMTRHRSAIACVCAHALLLLLTTGAFAGPREFSVDLWDWTSPCRDLSTFRLWAADLKKIGVTRIEISAPWNLLEPKPGGYDLSFVKDRFAIAKSMGLGMRIRVNSYYAGATPAWYDGERWCDIDGKPPQGTPTPVSLSDERFWSHYGPLCTKLAENFRGEDIYFNAFVGVHAELKWSDWWSYDASTLAAWRHAIKDRPAWMRDVLERDEIDLPDKPPIPPPTDGTPDTSPVSRAWIAFREQVWRDAIARFTAAIRGGDPRAKISAPLGESFRRGSAAMSNLDYFGLSRGADQIVHSYDFYLHTRDEPEHAAAVVAAFRGITGVQNIAFEFDGPALVKNLGYSEERQLRIARAAVSQGAGLKAANYSGSDALPSTYPVLSRFARLAASAARVPDARADQTVLLFFSKWANYSYREPTEWLHDAQFGAWFMLQSRGLPLRIICEDNLDEDLSHYRGLYVAFSPPQLLPDTAHDKLRALLATIPSVVELSETPEHAPPTTQPAGRPDLVADRWITLNYPLAYQWYRGDRAACRDLLDVCARFLSPTAATRP
jgi:hypothetical protein